MSEDSEGSEQLLNKENSIERDIALSKKPTLTSPFSQYDIGRLFEATKNFYRTFIEFQEEEAYDFFALWALGTYCFDIFRSYPYIYVLGVKEGGKSKLLYLTSLITKKSLLTANITTAALFRSIEKKKPTLIVDEMESLSKESKDDMRLIIQSGYKKGLSATRCTGEEHEPKDFDVYCPKIFASISCPNDVMESRCITIIMRRTCNRKIANMEIDGESVLWINFKVGSETVIINYSDKLQEIYALIEEPVLFGRDWELWKPILSMSKLISEDLYQKMRSYAIKKSKQRKEDEKDTPKFVIIQVLLDIIGADGWYFNSQILEPVKEQFEWMSPQKLGYELKELGLKSESSNRGRKYFLRVEDIKDIAERLGITVGQEDKTTGNT